MQNMKKNILSFYVVSKDARSPSQFLRSRSMISLSEKERSRRSSYVSDVTDTREGEGSQ
eukprot:UN15645